MDVSGCDFPEDRLYDVEHEVWVRPGPPGEPATLGILGSLSSFAGRFVSISFRPLDGPISAGRSVATLESARFTGAVRLPYDATVVERNPEIVRRPKLLNDSPYDRGWIVRISPPPSPLPPGPLEVAGVVRDRLEARIRELKIRCYPAQPDVELYEIGTECAAVLARLDEEMARRRPDEVVLLVTDDATSPIEMVRWADRTGESVLMHRRLDGLDHFLIRKEARPTPRIRGRGGAVAGSP